MAVTNVFTDGGCWGNPGPGAWACVIKADGSEIRKSGYDPATTNNRMELLAVISALEFLEAENRLGGITIHTDSQYVKNGITQWIHGWLRNNWKTAAKDPVKNKDLWLRLWELNIKAGPEWKWVKGHAGHPENELCDQLVQETLAAGQKSS